jgi:hypothetical protein
LTSKARKPEPTPRKRHVGDGDGRAHRLQHRIRFYASEQPAPISIEHKHHNGAAKQSRSSSVQDLQKPKLWKESNMSDGADDVIDLGICPICEKTLKLAYPDAADVNGLIVHTTCAAKAVEQPMKQ